MPSRIRREVRAKDIPGQKEMKQVFHQMVAEERLPHAMLIHSNEGGTGLALALHLSQLLFCEQPEAGEPCEICSGCTRTMSHTHPDIHHVFPVNGNKRVKKKEDRHSDSFLPEWREAIKANPFLELIDWYQAIEIENKQGFIGEEESASMRRKLALRSFEGGYRVFIIWHADKMNDSFANKMLKNLEEPTAKTVFLLVSENPAKLLPTIISRVQIFREDHVDEQELADFLVKHKGLDPQVAMNIAFRSEAHVSHALKEIDRDEDPWLTEFKMWMRLAYSRDISGLYKWSERMARKSRDAQRQYCKSALKVLDRCYRMGWLEMNVPMEGEEAKFYKDFSPFINTANVGGFLELLEEVSFHIERNVNEKIVWFDASISAVRYVHA
ncbi:hypothetical protein N8004_00930, partial [Salibacteraceae bacterium]|nr:hypothetical protein [Salibacteraceae bacterium]